MNTYLTQALSLAQKAKDISVEVLAGHIQREDMVKAVWLSLITGHPAFFLGTPGVDKTGTVQAMVGHIAGAVFFDALMPTIVSPEQLLVESTSIVEKPTGDPKALMPELNSLARKLAGASQEDLTDSIAEFLVKWFSASGKEIATKDKLGRAALAHVFFADEIWKAEPRVLQALLDLAKGDGVRHEGEMVETPLLSFLSASNELPDPAGNLYAAWSRMTLRLQVHPLSRANKKLLANARLSRDRAKVEAAHNGKKLGPKITITLDELALLRDARPFVEVPEEIVDLVLDILQELVNDQTEDFNWLWADDRRVARIHDVMQAHALINGRETVTKQDLAVLEWMLWDTPEQVAVVKAKIAPYCRTPLMDAQDLIDALLAPDGSVCRLLTGDRSQITQAYQQGQTAVDELSKMAADAQAEERAAISELAQKAARIREVVMEVGLGSRQPLAAEEIDKI